jgi:dephospho-CoA kinase
VSGERAAGSRSIAVALTGGIASGKSAAAECFRRLGVPIHDADVHARALVEPGSAALDEIVAAFGADVLTRDGALDRAAMRARVFANPAERRRLEAILHPRVNETLRAAARDCQAPYCVVVVPLLVEVWAEYAFVDRVLVVDVSPRVQLARLVSRDRSNEAAARAMIAAQAPRAQRLALATDVIDNDGAIAALECAVERLHAIYSGLGSKR